MGKSDVSNLPTVCPFCKRDLSERNLKNREEHIFTCIGDGADSPEPVTNSPEASQTANSPEKSPIEKIRRKCSLCGCDLQGSLKTRQEHLKKCSRREKLSPASRLSLLQAEKKFDSDSEPETVIKAAKNTKPKKSNNFKSVQHIEMPNCLADEELQLAVAMSESVADQKKSNEIQVQRNFDQILHSSSDKSINETIYNEASFHHPGLRRNNRIFERDYSAELLTKSQRDSIQSDSQGPHRFQSQKFKRFIFGSPFFSLERIRNKRQKDGIRL